MIRGVAVAANEYSVCAVRRLLPRVRDVRFQTDFGHCTRCGEGPTVFV